MNAGVSVSSAGLEPERRRWAARWVWDREAPETPSNSYFLFRGEFSVDRQSDHDGHADPAAGLRLFITAETRYRVLVNGRQIGEGPPPSPPHYQYYDSYDLTPHVILGANCLAVIVHFVGNEAGRELTRGGLLAEVTDTDGRVVAATGAAGGPEWRMQRAAAWRGQPGLFRLNVFDPFQEVHDARRMPAGWDRPGFDDSRWARPAVLRGATSAYEEWTINGSRRSGEFRGFMCTLSHAWSAHPAEFLIKYLMGLEIVEPGCTRVRLAPRDVPFDYDLTYPTPLGDVRVTRRGGTVEHHLPGGVTLA